MARSRRRFQNRLRKHRRIMGYSQKHVAWLLGFKNTSSICRWEKGVAMPNVENLLKLSYLYRTLCDELYYDFSITFRRALRDKEKELSEQMKKRSNGP
jgi:transcriptional regulator with XRE-family HTH domain